MEITFSIYLQSTCQQQFDSIFLQNIFYGFHIFKPFINIILYYSISSTNIVHHKNLIPCRIMVRFNFDSRFYWNNGVIKMVLEMQCYMMSSCWFTSTRSSNNDNTRLTLNVVNDELWGFCRNKYLVFLFPSFYFYLVEFCKYMCIYLFKWLIT